MPDASLTHIAVLVSGSGTNLAALVSACKTPALPSTKITHVISSSKHAYALTRASEAGIPNTVHNILPYKRAHPATNEGETSEAAREAFGHDLAQIILGLEPKVELIVCAGWMVVLPVSFLEPVKERGVGILNLHPALPGQFNGKDAIERSWKAHQSDKSVSAGVMIHEVIREVDEGKVIVSEAVEIREGEILDALNERIHEVEHRLIVTGTRTAIEKLRARLPG